MAKAGFKADDLVSAMIDATRTTLMENMNASDSWLPFTLTDKQEQFLNLDCREAFYGGAAGGGKSVALLADPLQYVHIPRFRAIIFRRTYKDLALPSAPMSRSKEWLMGTKAKWNERDKVWTFPSGATLTFGNLDTENDKFKYQSAEFQYIAFDELSHFTETQYLYLFSRLRKNKAMGDVPLKMRGASNPGGIGHNWVFERFVANPGEEGRVFIPAWIDDNPHLDSEEYKENLRELDEITRDQLLEGAWITDTQANPFDPMWWHGRNRYDWQDHRIRNRVLARVLSLDTAFKVGDEHDYTSCGSYELDQDYRLLTRGITEDKVPSHDLPPYIEEQVAKNNHDRKLHAIYIEDRGSGITASQSLTSTADPVISELIEPVATGTTAKEERARAAALWCKRGCVLLPHPAIEESGGLDWITPFQKQLFAFPTVAHDDMVDQFAQAINQLRSELALGWYARGAPDERSLNAIKQIA